MTKKYIPHAGDIVWINFNPQAGREQARRRPALILSPKIYNEKTSLTLLCPITSIEKEYPFEVQYDGQKVQGVILSDQVKSMDWYARDAEFIEKCPTIITEQVKEKIGKLLF